MLNKSVLRQIRATLRDSQESLNQQARQLDPAGPGRSAGSGLMRSIYDRVNHIEVLVALLDDEIGAERTEA